MADESIIADLKSQGFTDLIKNLDTAAKGYSLLDKSIAEANKELANLDKGSKAFKDLTKEINAATIATEAYSQDTGTLKKELRDTTNEIGNLERSLKALEKAGQSNSQVYKDLAKSQDELKKKAGTLKDTIGDLNAEIKNSGSNTKNLDKALRAINSVAAGYQIAQGALALFGGENKKFEQALIKLNAIMAITNGLQQIQNELSKKDSIFTMAAVKAKQLYTIVVGESTGALKGFKVALASTGIGLLVIAVGYLIANFDRLSTSGGVLSKVINSISDTTRRVIQDFKDLTDWLGITTFATDELAEAEKKRLSDLEGLYELDAKRKIGILKAQHKETATLELQELERKRNALIKQQLEAKDGEDKDAAERIKAINELGVEIAIKEAEIEQKKIDDIKKAAKIQSDLDKKLAKEREKDLKIIAANLKENIQEIFNEDVDLFPTKAQDRSKKYFTDIIAALERVVDNVEIGSDRWIYLNDQISKTKKLMDTIALSEEQVTKNAKESTDTIIQETFKKQDVKNKAFFEDLLKRKEDLKDEKLTQQDKLVIANASANALFQITAGISEFRKQTLDNELASGIISEKKYQEELRKIKRQEAIANKVQAVFNISLSIAEAIVKALTAGPIIGQVLAGITAGLGFAQLALVLATPIPKFAKGVIDLQDSKQPNGVDTVPAMLSKGESVMTVNETKENKDALVAMRKGKFKELFIPKANLIQPDIFANIPNPANIEVPSFIDKDDYSSITSRLDKLTNEMYYIAYYTKQGNRDRKRGTEILSSKFNFRKTNPNL